jgi:hypothetical protein
MVWTDDPNALAAFDNLLLDLEDDLNKWLDAVFATAPPQTPQYAMLVSFGNFVKAYSSERLIVGSDIKDSIDQAVNSILQEPIIQHLIAQAMGGALNRRMGV